MKAISASNVYKNFDQKFDIKLSVYDCNLRVV